MIKGKKYSAVLVELRAGREELRWVLVKALKVVRLGWDPEALLTPMPACSCALL